MRGARSGDLINGCGLVGIHRPVRFSRPCWDHVGFMFGLLGNRLVNMIAIMFACNLARMYADMLDKMHVRARV